VRSGRHRGQPTRHGSRRPRRTSVRHPCRTRLRRHVLVLVVLGRQRAEGARAGRFPALSISHAVNLRGQQAKHNGPLAQLGVACTSNQPTQTAKPKTPTAQRRGGRGKRTSCSTAGSGGRKLRGSFVLGAVTTACGTAAESGGSQLSSGTGKRRAGGPRGPRRAGRSLGPLVAVPITSVSVAYWVASARPVRRAYLILARRRPPPRRGADRTDEVSVRRFSCLGLGLGKRTCMPNHAWRDLCGQMWVRVFCGQKGGRGVAAFSAVQPPAGLYVRRWMIRDV
jgi:hypothetical protein